MADAAALARVLHAAWREGAPLPLTSRQASELTLDDAYAVQAELVALREPDDAVRGYKAALTDPSVQRAMGLDGPVTGVLFESGRRRVGDVVDLAPHRSLLLEMELV